MRYFWFVFCLLFSVVWATLSLTQDTALDLRLVVASLWNMVAVLVIAGRSER